MKRTSGGHRKGGVKWDEENLEENERIKAELNPIKINEPKTPYLSPMDTDDELDLEGAGMSPLSLEDDAPAPKRGANGGSAAGNGSWSDSERGCTGSSPGGSRSAGGVGSPGGGWGRRSPRFNDYYKDDSDTGVGSDDAEQAEKRRRFMELRKKHYNMRDALKKKAPEVPEGVVRDEDAGAEADAEDSEPGSAERAGAGLLAAAAAAAAANGHHAPEQGGGGDSS